MSDTCPTCGQPVRVHQSSEGTGCFVPEPSEEKIRAAFEASRYNMLCVRSTDGPAKGEYMYLEVENDWQKYRKAYLAGWKDRGGE